MVYFLLFSGASSNANAATNSKPASPAKSAFQSNSPALRRPGAKPAAYNLDFLEHADDPNFNPFQTKAKVANVFDENSIEDPSSKPFETKSKVANNDKLDDPNLDPFETKSKVASNFEDKLDDPDFNPFETKSKIVNNFDDRMEEDPNIDPFATKSKVMNENTQVIMFFLNSTVRISTPNMFDIPMFTTCSIVKRFRF